MIMSVAAFMMMPQSLPVFDQILVKEGAGGCLANVNGTQFDPESLGSKMKPQMQNWDAGAGLIFAPNASRDCIARVVKAAHRAGMITIRLAYDGSNVKRIDIAEDCKLQLDGRPAGLRALREWSRSPEVAASAHSIDLRIAPGAGDACLGTAFAALEGVKLTGHGSVRPYAL